MTIRAKRKLRKIIGGQLWPRCHWPCCWCRLALLHLSPEVRERRLGGVIFKVIRCFFKAVCVRCAMLKVLLRVSAFEIIRTISSVLADMRHFMRKDNRSSEMIGRIKQAVTEANHAGISGYPQSGGFKEHQRIWMSSNSF